MRPLVIVSALVAFELGAAVSSASSAAAPAALEQAWHGCVPDVFAHQNLRQSKAGAQRNALDECKDREDAFVAAMMAVQANEEEAARRSGRSLPARARAWAASVAAYVADPISSWIEMLRC